VSTIQVLPIYQKQIRSIQFIDSTGLSRCFYVHIYHISWPLREASPLKRIPVLSTCVRTPILCLYTTNTLFVRTFLKYFSRILLYARNPLVCLYTVNFVADVFSNTLVCHVCQAPPPKCACALLCITYSTYLRNCFLNTFLKYVSRRIRFSNSTRDSGLSSSSSVKTPL